MQMEMFSVHFSTPYICKWQRMAKKIEKSMHKIV